MFLIPNCFLKSGLFLAQNILLLIIQVFYWFISSKVYKNISYKNWFLTLSLNNIDLWGSIEELTFPHAWSK